MNTLEEIGNQNNVKVAMDPRIHQRYKEVELVDELLRVCGQYLTYMYHFTVYLGDPGYQQGIGPEHGVSQATAQSNEWIKFPTTNHELMEAKRVWQSMYKCPTAIGVTDCTHIGILKANSHGDEYIHRKGKPTLNVQATCDAREMFTSVDVSWPLAVHDFRIWRYSQTRSQLINKANVLLGDDGYEEFHREAGREEHREPVGASAAT
ncbi:unnamed protein product [Acanthoscelides obtectus]|uniref:DDE Tnp4 domain-containing protein n=1 Tax=Acanthoscelides obtectus TaxID=200917 RepID=A0A9P0JUS1_ACAOB|nr:unnamed protein product [Acanthoscelides obtectus]CAK1648876.1 Putative nuclease HARBI1 [Acanthoscelides obtectus]